jgi:ATP-dependent DNA ligase
MDSGEVSPLRSGRTDATEFEASTGLTGFAKPAANHYFRRMFKAFEFCIPITGIKVPAGPEWLHEIKYDGFRLRVERDGDRVRLFTRGGYDWTKRYPWIVEAALKNRQKRFVLDGEAVILGVNGISDFDALHSGRHNEEVQLCAFDLLAMDGDDLRDLPQPQGLHAVFKAAWAAVCRRRGQSD